MSKETVRLTRLPVIGALLISAVLAGCSFLDPREDPSRFFLLTSPAGIDDVASSEGGSVAVGPIDLPSYMNTPLLITRLNENEVAVSDYERWAEPLEDNIQRVLVENLSQELAINVVPFPAPIGDPARFRVPISIRRFDRDTLGNVELLVRWSIDDADDGRILDNGESSFDEPTRGAGSEESVATMSAALLRFSEEIAARVERAAGRAPR